MRVADFVGAGVSDPLHTWPNEDFLDRFQSPRMTQETSNLESSWPTKKTTAVEAQLPVPVQLSAAFT